MASHEQDRSPPNEGIKARKAPSFPTPYLFVAERDGDGVFFQSAFAAPIVGLLSMDLFQGCQTITSVDVAHDRALELLQEFLAYVNKISEAPCSAESVI